MTALKETKDNVVLNNCLRQIYKELEAPLQYKIRIIQTVCNDILNEGISVDQDIIMQVGIGFRVLGN